MRHFALFFSFLLASWAAQSAPLRIGVSETLMSLPLYVAEAEGFFQKRGVSVELVNCVGGNRCLKSMLAGQTELATATELPVMFNSFARSDFSILTSFVSVSNDLKVLARTDSKITKPVKLKDKTLGYIKGTASQYVLDLVLVYNGIDPDTVKLVELTPETTLAAMANKEVDALCVWEPFASRIILELGKDVQLMPIPKLYTANFNLVALQSAIKGKPQEIERVVRALKDGTRFIQTHPEKAKALAAKRLRIPIAVVNNIFDDYRFRLSLNRALPRTMEGQARWALREGHVNAQLPQPNYTGFFYPDFLKIVDPDAVSLQ